MLRKLIGGITGGAVIAGTALLLAAAGYGAKSPPLITMSATPKSPKIGQDTSFDVTIRVSSGARHSCALITPPGVFIAVLPQTNPPMLDLKNGGTHLFGFKGKTATVPQFSPDKAGWYALKLACVENGKLKPNEIHTFGTRLSHTKIVALRGGGVEQKASLILRVRG